jgi:pyruvate/2-oxoglutarate dehydrogenase complex dihydrolipoamide dehydrogenase (E3) component
MTQYDYVVIGAGSGQVSQQQNLTISDRVTV